MAETGDHVTVEITDERITWRKNGVIHRDDGPAVLHLNGLVCWYKDGILHREDGPALEQRDDEGRILRQCWRLNGLQHSHDGRHPAIIEMIDNGALFVQYFEHGVCTRHESEGPALSWFMPSGNVLHEFRLSGVLHRSTGPAIINAFSKEYLADATQRPRLQHAWYRYGKLSREDGPAEMFNAGPNYFSLDGVAMWDEEHFRKTLKSKGVSYTRGAAYKVETFPRPDFLQDTRYPDFEAEVTLAKKVEQEGGVYRPEVAQAVFNEIAPEAELSALVEQVAMSPTEAVPKVRERVERLRKKLKPS